MKTIYKVLLQLSNPLLIIVIGVIFCIETDSYLHLLSLKFKIYLYMMSFIALYLVPIVSLLLLKNIGTISNYTLSKSRDRIYPSLTLVLGLFFFYRTLIEIQISIPFSLRTYIYISIILSVIYSIVTYFWKIEPRSISFSFLASFLIIRALIMNENFSLFLIILILSYGIIESLQLKYEDTTVNQSLVAVILGTSGAFLSIFL